MCELSNREIDAEVLVSDEIRAKRSNRSSVIGR